MKRGCKCPDIRPVAMLALAAATCAQADTYGGKERVRVINQPPLEIVARLDRGSDGSSLSALDVKYFMRDGKTWTRFTIDNGSVLPGNHISVERQVLRDLKIRQRNGGVEHQPLIQLSFCLGDRVIDAKVTVSDRSDYTVPLVIGRSELDKLGAVDESRQFTQNARCTAPPVPPAAPKT